MIVYYFKSENRRQEDLLQDKNEILSLEKDKSEKLLLNILPADIAEELKEKGSSEPNYFDQVTVLFSDFKDFTKLTEMMSPSELVNELNQCFTVFDQIMEDFKIEKIKTIGDSYMCAKGLEDKDDSHPKSIIKAAIKMQEFMVHRRKNHRIENKPFFEMRIGIHTGPVVAGIVGVKKFAYDIWGDTVNIASRMESACDVDQINISQTTYKLIKNQFVCEYRGKIEAKNKGDIDMYYLIKEK